MSSSISSSSGPSRAFLPLELVGREEGVPKANTDWLCSGGDRDIDGFRARFFDTGRWRRLVVDGDECDRACAVRFEDVAVEARDGAGDTITHRAFSPESVIVGALLAESKYEAAEWAVGGGLPSRHRRVDDREGGDFAFH